MNVPSNNITRYATLAAVWAGKSAIALILVAVLGFTQGLYRVDVRFNAGTPQVQLVVLESLPHLYWHKLLHFAKGLFGSSQAVMPNSHDQACHQSQKQQIG